MKDDNAALSECSYAVYVMIITGGHKPEYGLRLNAGLSKIIFGNLPYTEIRMLSP